MQFLIESLVISTTHCRLCCWPFPENNTNTWQSKFRAVLYLGPSNNDQKNTFLTHCATLPDINTAVDVSIVGLPCDNIVRVLRDSIEYQARDTAFCFHDECFWVFKAELTKIDPSFTIGLSTRLYNLVQSLGPIDLPLLSVPRIRELVDNGSHFCREIKLPLMSKLPPELTALVWENVGLKPCSSVAIGEIARLARSLIRPKCHTLSLSSHLLVNTICVFGTKYIQRFLDETADDDCNTDVIGLIFVTDLFGIQAIKLLGRSRNSNWIGELPEPSCRTWYGRVRGKASTIHFTANSLCYTHISSSEESSTNPILWDQIAIPSSLVDPNSTLFDFERDVQGKSSSSPVRHLRYLSLYHEDEYTTGLTLFVSGSGISGLEAHFTKVSLLSGCRDGCARHFSLDPDERIKYAWLRITLSSFAIMARPSLVIQTTRGRVCSFGSYILPDYVQQKYRWFRLESEGYIVGFYYEASKMITRLGITSDACEDRLGPQLPLYHDSDYPLIAGPDAGLFVSVACLVEIKRIEICQTADRCIGMLLHYFDKPPGVLGQWNTSYSCRCIHDSNRASITGIGFTTKVFGDHNILTEIHILRDETSVSSGSNFQVFRTGEIIAWWFSDFYDLIAPWGGNIVEIPRDNELRQLGNQALRTGTTENDD